MPSYKIVVNFVSDIADNYNITASDFEKNSWVGLFIDGIEVDRWKTSSFGDLIVDNKNVETKDEADLLNISGFTMSSPEFPTTGSIGFIIADNIKLELRYI